MSSQSNHGGQASAAAATMDDPISGRWESDAGNLLELRFDGRRGVTGSVPAGHPGNLATIRSGTFDRQSRALTLEGEARRPDNGAVVPYAISGVLDGGRLRVSYQFGNDRGSATLRRATWWSDLRRRAGAIRRAALSRLERLIGYLLASRMRVRN